jgi:hypothetical protein
MYRYRVQLKPKVTSLPAFAAFRSTWQLEEHIHFWQRLTTRCPLWTLYKCGSFVRPRPHKNLVPISISSVPLHFSYIAVYSWVYKWAEIFSAAIVSNFFSEKDQIWPIDDYNDSVCERFLSAWINHQSPKPLWQRHRFVTHLKWNQRSISKSSFSS